MAWWDSFRKKKGEPAPQPLTFDIGGVKVQMKEERRLIVSLEGMRNECSAVKNLIIENLNLLPSCQYSSPSENTLSIDSIYPETVKEILNQLQQDYPTRESVHQHLALKQAQRSEQQEARQETYQEKQARQAVNPYLLAAVKFIEERGGSIPLLEGAMVSDDILKLQNALMEAYRQQKKGPGGHTPG